MERLTFDKAKKIAAQIPMPAPFDLAVAGEANIPDIVGLGAEIFSYNPPSRKEVSYYIRKAHGACFVVTDRQANALAAYVYFEAHSRRQCLYLNTVAVAAAYQGRGLGTALYALGDCVAKSIQARALYCHVRPDNAANLHMMEKHGFIRQRIEEKYYDDGSCAYVFKKTYE